MKENNRVKARLNFLLIPRLLQLNPFFFMTTAYPQYVAKTCRKQVHPGDYFLWCVAPSGFEGFLNLTASFLSITGKDDIRLQTFETQRRVIQAQDMKG